MRLAKIFLVVAALAVCACQPDNGGNGSSAPKINWVDEGSIVGEWTLASFSGKSDSAPRVYIKFTDDDKFEMYQQVYSAIWFRYDGTYTLSEDNILSGVYSDNEPWSATYKVSYGEEESKASVIDPSFTPATTHIRLVNIENETEVSVYDTTTIPEEIIDESREPQNVRSVALPRFL